VEIDEAAATSTIKIVIGILSAAGAGLITMLAYGRKIGSFEQRLIDAEKVSADLAQAMVKLREYHDADMKEVRDFFRSPDGGQKFMTFGNHDDICERNSRVTVQQFQVMNDLLRSQTIEITRLSAEVSALSTAVAILQDRRVVWRPQSPPDSGGQA